MNEDPRQNLSLLLDGEGTARERHRALADVLDDPELQARWERYHLIGQAIRGEPLRLGARGVAERVRNAIDAEASTKIVPLRGGRGSAPRHRPDVRLVPLTAALAAGIALLAVFLLPVDRLLGPADPGNDPRIAESGTAGTQPPATVVSASRWQSINPVVMAKLDQLLVSHHERVPVSGIPGLVSYVGVVGYEARP